MMKRIYAKVLEKNPRQLSHLIKRYGKNSVEILAKKSNLSLPKLQEPDSFALGYCQFLGRRLNKKESENNHAKIIELGLYYKPCEKAFCYLCHHPAINTITAENKCYRCEHKKPHPTVGHTLKPLRVVRFDEWNLARGVVGKRFNPSIIQNRDNSSGEYLFCFRNGWVGSNLYVVKLDSEFRPISDAILLEIEHPAANYGREDPRLFRLNGQLHVSFTGVVGGTQIRHTNVLFARLNNDTFKVEDVFHPIIPQRQHWEKNHAYFDYNGTAHAIYSIAPHKILRIQGNRTTWAYETPTNVSWSGGRLSGGAAPVFHNGEWYHFFHGSNEHGRRIYNIGCYTFSPTPPFAIRRFTPHPIEIADTTIQHDNYCHVTFPGGAVFREGEWIIATGIHDRWSHLHFYDAMEVERAMVKV